MEVLKFKNLKPWMNPGEVFRATAKRDAKYIEWSVIDGRFQVSLRKNAVSQAISIYPAFLKIKATLKKGKAITLKLSSV